MIIIYLLIIYTVIGTISSAFASTAINGCPNLDFEWHAENTNTTNYSLNVTSVNHVTDNIFNITIHVQGAESIPLKYLWSLKVIGIDGPQSLMPLYSMNEDIRVISSPTNFTTTFEVYASLQNCEYWMPNFQIQFEYLEGSTYQYASTWKWGTTVFDLCTGCDNYDNQGHSQTDFPGFYWLIGLPLDCNNNITSNTRSTSRTGYPNSRTIISSSKESVESFYFPSQENLNLPSTVGPLHQSQEYHTIQDYLYLLCHRGGP